MSSSFFTATLELVVLFRCNEALSHRSMSLEYFWRPRMKSCQHVAATHAQHACLSFGPVLYPLCPWTPRGCAIEFEFGGLVAVFAQRQDGIVAVPLFMSTDLRYVPAASKEILLNPGLLQISQDALGRAGHRFVQIGLDAGAPLRRHGRCSSQRRRKLHRPHVGQPTPSPRLPAHGGRCFQKNNRKN